MGTQISAGGRHFTEFPGMSNHCASYQLLSSLVHWLTSIGCGWIFGWSFGFPRRGGFTVPDQIHVSILGGAGGLRTRREGAARAEPTRDSLLGMLETGSMSWFESWCEKSKGLPSRSRLMSSVLRSTRRLGCSVRGTIKLLPDTSFLAPCRLASGGESTGFSVGRRVRSFIFELVKNSTSTISAPLRYRLYPDTIRLGFSKNWWIKFAKLGKPQFLNEALTDILPQEHGFGSHGPTGRRPARRGVIFSGATEICPKSIRCRMIAFPRE